MGQLEKYGLYVMCLVIFLILGVTLWGEPANATRTVRQQQQQAQVGAQGPMEASFRPRSERREIHELLQPEPRPSRPDVGPTPADDGPAQPGSGRVTVEAPPVQPQPPQPAPSAPKTVRYTIKKGDSLSRIAQRQLGSVRFVDAIVQLNAGMTRDSTIRVGKVLTLPARVEGASERKEPSGDKTTEYSVYRVRKGDSYHSIARSQLGSIDRWKEIRRLNPRVVPTRLQLGQEIKLPIK